MAIRNREGFRRARAEAIGGKGLMLALALAGAGIQGCGTQDAVTGPAGADDVSAAPREDKTGADLKADGSPANPGDSKFFVVQVALAKAAPSCVRFETFASGLRRYAEVINECKTDQRLRFIWAWAVDGQCVTVPAGNPPGIHFESRGRQAYVTEVRGC